MITDDGRVLCEVCGAYKVWTEGEWEKVDERRSKRVSGWRCPIGH